MSIPNPTRLFKVLLLPLPLALASCGSDNETKPEEPLQPPVVTESCKTANNGADNCPDIVNDGSAQALTLNASVTDSLSANTTKVFSLAADTEVTLISNSGDVDLFLYENESDINFTNPYRDDNRLCGSWWGFKEDHCTASSNDGEIFALVVAKKDSNYTINATNDCSVPVINQWVYRNMKDYYLYADRVPNVNPDNYADTSNLVRALRYEEVDPYSYIADAAAQSDYYEAGKEFGLGFGWRRDSQGDLRIRYVYKDSAFGRAGIKRGDIAVSLEGEAIDRTMSNERYNELTGTRENPRTSNWTFIDRDTGATKNISATIGSYTLNTVLYTGKVELDDYGITVGHLVFKNFIGPSEQELDRALQWLADNGVDELVLDLRYNGGGRSSVSRKLASQIAGATLDGKLHSKFEHNSKYSQFNYSEEFYEATPALNLSRLIVLTSGDTASASERLINSLSAYIDVVTIGDRTEGKAFRSSGRKFCGKSLSAMTAKGVNANGVSVERGIPATCYARDDLSHGFNDNREGMFNSAIQYMINGSCDAQPFAKGEQAAPYPQTHEAAFAKTIGL